MPKGNLNSNNPFPLPCCQNSSKQEIIILTKDESSNNLTISNDRQTIPSSNGNKENLTTITEVTSKVLDIGGTEDNVTPSNNNQKYENEENDSQNKRKVSIVCPPGFVANQTKNTCVRPLPPSSSKKKDIVKKAPKLKIDKSEWSMEDTENLKLPFKEANKDSTFWNNCTKYYLEDEDTLKINWLSSLDVKNLFAKQKELNDSDQGNSSPKEDVKITDSQCSPNKMDSKSKRNMEIYLSK